MFENATERKLVEAAGSATSGTTAQPLAKLAVGILAGVSAVLLPRVLALTAQSDGTQLVFFPTPYFVLAAGVGLFVGMVMLVFEYQVPAKPRDTFMAALGIPAIISGALGTASGADSVTRIEREASQLRQAVGQEQGIVKSGTFQSIEPLDKAAAPKPPAKSGALGFSLVGTAYAGEPLAQAQADDPVRFGVRVEQPKYVVVLRQAPNAEQAMRDEQELRRQLPAARAVKADRGYFVILGASPAGETDALLAAARAKKLTNDAVQPVLVEVKR
jgi:hypothetical protein